MGAFKGSGSFLRRDLVTQGDWDSDVHHSLFFSLRFFLYLTCHSPWPPLPCLIIEYLLFPSQYWEREEVLHMVPVLWLGQNEHTRSEWDPHGNVRSSPRRCGTILSAKGIQKCRENENLGQSSKSSREDWNFSLDRPGSKILTLEFISCMALGELLKL